MAAWHGGCFIRRVSRSVELVQGGAMRLSGVRSISWWMTAAVLLPVAARAQTPATDFERLPQILRSGQTVIITTTDRHTTRGRIAEISPSAVVVAAPDSRTFERADIARIQKTDSIWNGLLIGAAVGGAVAAIGFASTRGRSDLVYDWGYIASWLAPAAGGTTGALIDRASNRTIYDVPSAAAGYGPAVYQDLEARRQVLQFSVRF